MQFATNGSFRFAAGRGRWRSIYGIAGRPSWFFEPVAEGLYQMVRSADHKIGLAMNACQTKPGIARAATSVSSAAEEMKRSHAEHVEEFPASITSSL